MKKLLACILALVMCLGIFAGCTTAEPVPTGEQTQPVDTTPVDTAPEASLEDLESAAAYVKAMYQEGSDAISTPQSYNRIGSVNVAGVDYPVTWAVDVPENVAKVVANDDGSYTIEIIAEIEEDTYYTLSATVSNAAGQTAVVHFSCFIPAPLGSMTDIVDMAYALEEGETLDAPATLTGVITAIDTPYSSQYKNITVTIQVEGREDKPIMCYRLKGEGAEDLMPGDTITVTGNIKNYKGTIEFDAGCNLDKVVKGENSFEMPTDPKDIVNTAYELEVGQALPKQVTLTGMITSIDSVYSERYNNISVWMVVEGMYDKPIMAFRMKGADVDKIWLRDTITVTGIIKNYQGTIEFDAGCTMDSWQNTGGDPSYPKTHVEAVEALYNLGENEAFPGIHSLSGRVISAEEYALNYGNQTLTIEVPGAEGKPVICYRMTTGGNMDIKAGDYVTVRGNLEDYKGKKQLTNGYLTKWDPTTLEEAIEEAKGLANNDHLPYDSTITGTIKIDTAYSAQYSNITFTVTNADGVSLQAYRIKGYGADQLVDGDVVTVTGPLTAYKGKPQFDSQATFTCDRLLPKTLADQYEAAKSLADKAYLPVESTATGVVTIKTAYDPSYKNVSFNVTTPDGITVYCYRIKGTGMDTLADGDTVTITGFLTAYKGTPQFDSTAKATVVAKGEGTVTPPENPDEIPATFAEQMAQAVANGSNNYESTLTAEVTVYTKAGNDAGHHRFTISDGTVTLECYYSDCGDYVPAVGDTVKVTGKLGSYGGKAQFTDSAKVELVKAGEGGSTTPTVPATFAEQMADAVANGTNSYASTFTGTVSDCKQEADYQGMKSFTFNLSNGTDTIYCYKINIDASKFIADGDTVTITDPLTSYGGKAQFAYSPDAITIVNNGEGGGTVTPPVTPPAEGAAASIDFSVAENRTSWDTTQQTWTANGITVVNLKSASTSNVADYTNPARFYKNSSLSIGYTGMTKIEFVANSASYATALANSLTAESVANTVSGSSVIVEFAEPVNSFTINALSGGQVRMNQINIFVAEAETPDEGEGGETALTAYEIAFDDTSKRTEFSTEKQVWTENGIVFTNLKSASTNNVADYSAPARLYAGSSATISFNNIKKISFNVNASKYVAPLVASLEAAGFTCNTDGLIVTVELDSAVNAFEIPSFTAQVRLNGLTVYA